MVVAKGWLSDLRAIVGTAVDCSVEASKKDCLRILAFEAAAAMSRLVSLHRGLEEPEILRLRSETMRSQGVGYLNSKDQFFLLRLACAEYLDDLDRAADAISRLERKCRFPGTKSFLRVYSELKSGNVHSDRLGPSFGKKGVEKKMKKMEKYIDATSKLCSEMEALEVSRQKLNKQWNRFSGPIPTQNNTNSNNNNNEILVEIKSQEQKIHKLKEESLWSQTFEKVVKLMSTAAFFVFASICAVFGPFVPGLPPVVTLHGKNSSSASSIWFAPPSKLRVHPRSSVSSGPVSSKRAGASKEETPIRNSCPIFGSKDKHQFGDWVNIMDPPPATVGAASMALRYADVIVAAEKQLTMRMDPSSPLSDKDRKWEAAVRDEMYQMLPESLRAAMRRKLRECWREGGGSDGHLAEGWKEAVERILKWLAPMAHDTLRWQAERNMDRRQWFETKPKALLLQTLHFADKEKTEAAIVEVLVGLSCVCLYEERRCGSSIRVH